MYDLLKCSIRVTIELALSGTFLKAKNGILGIIVYVKRGKFRLYDLLKR